jgi:hypothetical protein
VGEHQLESGRDRRRDKMIKPGRAAPTATPAALSPLLALQRRIGNRAVVQRLVYKATTGVLTVPTDYASKRIAWDGNYVTTDDATDQDQTFLEHAKADHTFREHVAAGLDLPWVQEVKAASKADIENGAAALVSDKPTDNLPGDRAVMVHAAVTPAAAHNKMLAVPDRRFTTVDSVRGASRLVRYPKDYLPTAPDLPGADVDLATPIPGMDKKYWEYACVLIALFKAEGIAAVRQITQKPKVEDNVRKAVQALHAYYIGKNVQYDDGAARSTVMSEWGYHLVFSGDAHWEDLPGQVSLPAGTYIFDITGHTVKVRVLRDIDSQTRIEPRSDYFEPDSDPSNFTRGNEFAKGKTVSAIWKK